MNAHQTPDHRLILGTKVNTISFKDASKIILYWSTLRRSRCIYCADAHLVMRSYDSKTFNATINSADLVTSDGAPITWMLRWNGVIDQERVTGPDLMLHVCKAASDRGIPIGLYGSTETILSDLCDNLQKSLPALQIKYTYSPPFRPLTEMEEKLVVTQIKDSGTQILFVALGCPKQEIWIQKHQDRLPIVMLGVGWAFAVHAQHSSRAPKWMQRAGMESLYQITIDPERYLKRYLTYLPRFCFLALISMATSRLGSPD